MTYPFYFNKRVTKRMELTRLHSLQKYLQFMQMLVKLITIQLYLT